VSSDHCHASTRDVAGLTAGVSAPPRSPSQGRGAGEPTTPKASEALASALGPPPPAAEPLETAYPLAEDTTAAPSPALAVANAADAAPPTEAEMSAVLTGGARLGAPAGPESEGPAAPFVAADVCAALAEPPPPADAATAPQPDKPFAALASPPLQEAVTTGKRTSNKFKPPKATVAAAGNASASTRKKKESQR
jgi:hypothetical protein